MLTQDQRDTFRLALAAWSNTSATDRTDLDISDVCHRDGDVVETRDTIENFFEANGRRLSRQGQRPATPYEQESTILGDVFVWRDRQARKGCRRGTLWVMDFGDARAAYFDGEA